MAAFNRWFRSGTSALGSLPLPASTIHSSGVDDLVLMEACRAIIRYEQVNRVRNLHVPGIMLFGFQSKSEFTKIVCCKPFNFIYPHDRHILGSKRLFRALWERCRDFDKVTVCLLTSKSKSMLHYVALIPVSRENATVDSYHSLLANDSFKNVCLPYNCYNSLENHASDGVVVVCEKLVRKLRLIYHPSSQYFPDPQSQGTVTAKLFLEFEEIFG
uniref:Ku domain-containing protein n=1 Tax=Glossina palpalis gambiensis TaxID=67801 RepID=A0A1B0C558_9MUSC